MKSSRFVPPTDVAVLVSYSGDGGVERMINNLVQGLLDAGCVVDVIVLRNEGGHIYALPAGANVVRLGTRHAVFALPGLVLYLRRARPRALLAAKDRAGRVAIRARRLAGVPTRIVVRIGNTLSQSLAGRSRLRRMLRYGPIRRLYPLADAIVAVSQGVADDVVATSGVDRARVAVLPNPVITRELDERARESVDHPWLCEGAAPVILSVGRLTRQKDFPTLLKAFARVRRQREARLLILGEGEDRRALERLADELGIADALDLAGFAANPYAYMVRADLFVLSSAWEGSPNALTEAMHLGVPVVATDCRSGPREVLDGGRIAPLVPVGDFEAMAAAIVATLDAPPDGATLRVAVAGYTRERSTARYLEVLGIEPPKSPC
ncbi:glycosyltransferase [Halofilum ochraceum]|uniref:glycosyltransferase n=1 Tax=Halofilum ochraceum TaxID=1611323 RepID=UPI000835D602|nr:glycosyltransferase [Halofilum ochraceum]